MYAAGSYWRADLEASLLAGYKKMLNKRKPFPRADMLQHLTLEGQSFTGIKLPITALPCNEIEKGIAIGNNGLAASATTKKNLTQSVREALTRDEPMVVISRIEEEDHPAFDKTGGTAYGCFAAPDIPAFTTLGVYGGVVLRAEEAAMRKEESKDSDRYLYDLSLYREAGKGGGGLFCLDGFNLRSEMGMVNDYRNFPPEQEKTPNARAEECLLWSVPSVVLVAVRKINKGEEILSDYGPQYWATKHFEKCQELTQKIQLLEDELREALERPQGAEQEAAQKVAKLEERLRKALEKCQTKPTKLELKLAERRMRHSSGAAAAAAPDHHAKKAPRGSPSSKGGHGHVGHEGAGVKNCRKLLELAQPAGLVCDDITRRRYATWYAAGIKRPAGKATQLPSSPKRRKTSYRATHHVPNSPDEDEWLFE
ncbi:unnamed protein product [Vitrella brassicaformis CCMP3155]|uniref:SET domain-containing protein n=2 Tax=Vitrella brassicaformis TaxID=1169539 RepID=A0A0G4EUN6_VITBC|nr:unnamed protein product [Vitrella brassicaformis CCMP3155]|eukprot:CEM02036.1 unnamed protein product [Vitrella brassicaformis CCMP3155]